MSSPQAFQLHDGPPASSEHSLRSSRLFDDIHEAQDHHEGDTVIPGRYLMSTVYQCQVGEKRTGLGSSNSPRPILHQVVAVYFLSVVLDSPNWVVFETKV